jgi:hypothetical protein
LTFADLIAAVLGRLDRAGIPFMITGSIASSFHGEPRATRDLDIVIDPSPDALDWFVDDLVAAGFYVDPGVARDAFARRTQFNAIGPDASKVDFIIRKDRPFSVEEFGRRERVDLLGTSGFITSAEDLVIAKLEWAAATDSDRQRRDVIGILAVADEIDLAYVERWAAALGLQATWASVKEEAAGA